MAKWVLAVGGLVVLALLWKVCDSLQSPAKAPVVAQPRDADVRLAPMRHDARRTVTRTPRPAPPTDGAPSRPGPAMIDPKSSAFSDRIDIVIADKFRGHIADCYKGGDDPDKVIKIKYTLRIVGGLVHATNVTAAESELDTRLEQCMLTAMRHANWRARDMPDFEEEEELFVRLRALKKYRSRKKAR